MYTQMFILAIFAVLAAVATAQYYYSAGYPAVATHSYGYGYPAVYGGYAAAYPGAYYYKK